MTFEQETAAAIELLTSICKRLANAVATLQDEQAELREELLKHAVAIDTIGDGKEIIYYLANGLHSVKV